MYMQCLLRMGESGESRRARQSEFEWIGERYSFSI